MITLPEEPPVANRIDRSIALLLAAATLGLYTWRISGMENIAGQFSKYPLAANQLLAGNLPNDRLFDFSPAYLWLCAFIANTFDRPFQALQYTQWVLMALTAACLYLLLRHYFNRVWSAIGATAFATNASVMVYAYIFEPEALLVFLLVATVLLAHKPGVSASIAAGILVTLCLLTRPAHILLIAAIPLFQYYRYPPASRRLATACFLAPVFLGLSGFAMYSLHKGGPFPPPVMNPGIVFFEGNNPTASGHGASYPPLVKALGDDFPGESDYQHALYRLVARRDTGTQLSAREVNSYWAKKALNYIIDQPIQAVKLLFQKSFYIFHSFRWHDIRAAVIADLALNNTLTPLFPFAPVAALAFFGLIAGVDRWRDFLLPYTLCASQTALMLLTYASDRQRVAMIPFLIFFAVAGIAVLLRTRQRMLVAGLLLTALTFLLANETDRMRDNRRVWTNFEQIRSLLLNARAQRDALQFDQATKSTAMALSLAPWADDHGTKLAEIPGSTSELAVIGLDGFLNRRGENPTALLDRGLLLAKAERWTEAEQLMTHLQPDIQSLDPYPGRPPIPQYYLGQLAALQGNNDKAAKLFKQALELAPGDPATLAGLAANSGDAQYAERLTRYFGRLETARLLGLAYLDSEQPAKAVSTLENFSKDLPEHRGGLMALAAALSAAGSTTQACNTFLDAMSQRTEPVMFQDRIVTAFRLWAETSDADKIPHYWYGKVLRQFGMLDEAQKVLRASYQASGRPEVAEELQQVSELVNASSIKADRSPRNPKHEQTAH